jgi:signal transduction histidine kinase
MRFIFSIQLLLIINLCFAQKQGNAMADSLKLELSHSNSDTIRAKILNKISHFYSLEQTDSALKYTEMGMQIVIKMKWYKGMSVFSTCYGNIYSNIGKLDSSIKRNQDALHFALLAKDTVNQAVAYNNLGANSNAKSDYISATKYYMQTLAIGKALKNYSNIGIACENLALVFEMQEDYAKELDYAKQSLAAYTIEDEEESYSSPLNLMGSAFSFMKKYDSAYYYYQKALASARKNNNKLKEAAILNGISVYFAKQKIYSNALQYGLEAKKIWDNFGPGFEDAINNTGLIGEYYFELARQKDAGSPAKEFQLNDSRETLFRLAGRYLEEAVKKTNANGNKTSESEFSRYLSEIDANIGNYKDAYYHFKTYQEIKDSVYSQENKNKIATLEGQQKIEIKNKEIINKELLIENQRKSMWLMVSVIAFLIATGFVIYRQSILRKKTNTTLLKLNNELNEANKLKAKFFGIISHDLRSPIANHLNFLQLQKLKPGLMSEEKISARADIITQSAQSLLDTMEAMLLWSKGQMEHFHPNITAVSAQDLFLYIQNFFSADNKIGIQFNDPFLISIQTDLHFLQTIMQNLTANAIKALENTPHASIEWKAWQQDGNTFLSIKDNGKGTSREQLQALYDEKAGMGSRNGLGLHIIRDLAKAICCGIELNSGYQQGTEFILSFQKNNSIDK